MRRVSYWLLASFTIVLAVSLFAGKYLIAQGVSVVENSADLENAAFFFGYILAATIVLLLILKFYKGKKLFQWLEFALEFSAIQIFLLIFVSELFSLIGALVLVVLRYFQPRLKTPFLMFATAIVGALLGSSLDLLPAMILAWLLSAYDYYSVFHSKHMVFLAKQLGNREAAFAISLKDGKENVLLGTGDFVMPSMLAVAALKISSLAAFSVAAGALVGLAILIWYMEKNRGYYPALPPIVAGASIFFSASMLIGV